MSRLFEIELGARPFRWRPERWPPRQVAPWWSRYGDAMVLVTATMGPPREGGDFLPLTVDYEERLYAVGRIPGSFFRREGRPGTDAILTARLTDRPLRPRFPKGFRNEIQVIATVLSADQITPAERAGLLSAPLPRFRSPRFPSTGLSRAQSLATPTAGSSSTLLTKRWRRPSWSWRWPGAATR